MRDEWWRVEKAEPLMFLLIHTDLILKRDIIRRILDLLFVASCIFSDELYREINYAS